MATTSAKKNSTVQTDSLTIEGNLLKWSGTIIQISSISLISTTRVAAKPFPIISLIMAVLGIILTSLGSNSYGMADGLTALGIALLVAAGIWMLLWASERKSENEKENLNILLNAGPAYTIVFNDKKFLADVMRCFETILRDQTHDEKMVINIKDNVITGDATVIDQINTH